MDDANLRKIYEQYWLHARHVENERLWFTNIYAVIVAGFLAYLGVVENNNPINLILIFFLLILSLFGYIITQAWNIPFVIFSRLAEEIAICEWKLPEEYRRFTKYSKGYDYYKFIGIGKLSIRISASRAFIGFYSIMIGVFIALSYQIIRNINDYKEISMVFIVVSVTFYFYYHLYLEKKTLVKIRTQFNERVNKCLDKKKTS
ncbi:MAG: hypothetical protein BV456_10380 [Thermoplasmata archaeon M8B2D]|nr:MAG: hypothetical protein BV456_10380 [Thermoplasmata archaeon M8B2D]